MKRCTPFLSLLIALALVLGGGVAFAAPQGGGAATLTCRVTGHVTRLDFAPTEPSGAASFSFDDDHCCVAVSMRGAGKAAPPVLRKAACCDVNIAQDQNAAPVITNDTAPLAAPCVSHGEQRLFPPRVMTLAVSRFPVQTPPRRGPPPLFAVAPRGPPRFS